MKIALFGGTFDPIHNGHLAVAKAAADRFGLDRVLFVPAGRPPHKESAPRASYEHRCRMAELACRCDARFEASRLEDPHVVGKGKTFSIDTIETVKRGLSPHDALYFLLGQDAFEELAIWHRLDDVVREVEFIVATRPGASRPLFAAGPAARATAHWLTGLEIPISASALRSRLARGEDADDSLPAPVASYIRRHRLYQ